MPGEVGRGGQLLAALISTRECERRTVTVRSTGSPGACLRASGIGRAAAIENGAHGIRVVALAPGMTGTPMLDVHRPDGLTDGEWAAAKAEFGRQGIDALRRMATPEEMASAALGLASPDFAFQTGSVVLVDGGQLAGIWPGTGI
ncbi:SDR family oxidoreductase [Streptomyces niveus]|uniref:SDR family oxidoreductase n=1 Tax=Streptomyces niveus TaxID=193462 RepID=UPI0036B35C62